MRCRLAIAALLLVAGVAAIATARAGEQDKLHDLLERADALSTAGQYAEAYSLLQTGEDEFIGDVPFDYALGRAALNAGRPDRATLAFSRVLAVDPLHAGARIDMGRAYLALGNRAQAEVMFRTLLREDPPPAIRAQLLVYLAQASGEGMRNLATRGYLAVMAGTSSNVNQAPGQAQVYVPGLAAILVLSDQNVSRGDNFAGVAAGGDAALALKGRLSAIGSVDVLARANQHETDFNVGGFAASAGLAWAGPHQLVRVQLQALRNTLGGSTSRDVRAISVDVSEPAPTPGSPGSIFGFLHYGTFRHPEPELAIFDANFAIAGVGGVFQYDEKSTVSVAFLANGENDRGGNPDGDRRGFGLRIAWEALASPRVKLGLVGGALGSQYDSYDPAFLTVRRDRQADISAYAQYELTSQTDLRIGVYRATLQSTIPIYEYGRTDWTITLRRRFD
jgi:tetratricopeptide (TPR) repeat protein